MSKVFTFMIITVGLVLLMKFAGLPSGADSLLVYLGIADDISGISLGAFFIATTALFAVSAVVGSIIIGAFVRAPPESGLMATLCIGLLAIFTSTWVSIINSEIVATANWVYYIVLTIGALFLTGFLISIIQFWRGAD